MAFKEPFLAFTAASNMEARAVANMLTEAGITADVEEDEPSAGLGFGSTSEAHAPKVWIETADGEKSEPIVAEYERRLALRRKPADGPITVVCEECGKSSLFPPDQNGSTQNCPHCDAYVDVGDSMELEGWEEDEDEEEKDEE